MYLEVSATKHAFVQYQGLSDKMWFGELHIGISKKC